VNQWLMILAVLLGTPALAQTAAPAHHANSRTAATAFRLQEPQFQSPLASSGIAPETALSENSTLGFGIIRARPKTPDGRLYGPAPGHRSAGVRFRIKF
jgi:hypothetical protein